jgi:hypothetical protein
LSRLICNCTRHVVLYNFLRQHTRRVSLAISLAAGELFATFLINMELVVTCTLSYSPPTTFTPPSSSTL